MSVQERIEHSRTKIFKAVFPNTTNHYDTLFGGAALQLMDEVAFICATRFTRKKMVTVSTGKVDFEKPIPSGSFIEVDANVESVGKTSVKVRINIYREDMYRDFREKAISGLFTLVAIDENKKPVSVL